MQSHQPNICRFHLIVFTAVLEHYLVSTMTILQIAEVTCLLIRIFNTFLKVKRMLTETVFTQEKSTMKHITQNLNHETKEIPIFFQHQSIPRKKFHLPSYLQELRTMITAVFLEHYFPQRRQCHPLQTVLYLMVQLSILNY